MTRHEQEALYDLFEKYNGGIEPIESWTSKDLVKVVDLIDAELQRREFEKQFDPFYEIIV